MKQYKLLRDVMDGKAGDVVEVSPCFVPTLLDLGLIAEVKDNKKSKAE